jgi:predicted ArsR family transcriptional regulator
MAKQAYPTTATTQISIPQGAETYWKVILDLDEAGPWTTRQIDLALNVPAQSIRNYVMRLEKGGFVQIVGAQPSGIGTKTVHLYELTSRPVEAPRVKADGTLVPEEQIQKLWRAMKMAKTFTGSELAGLVGAPLQTAKRYIRRLEKAGVLSSLGTQPGMQREYRYQLVDNVGLRAPQILQSRLVFDPNSGRVLAEIETTQVQP